MAPASPPAAEHVAGPVCGLYLAAYSVRVAEGFIGYARVCTRKPESVWDGTPAIRKVSAGPCPTEQSAVAMVLKKAEEAIWESSEFQVFWEEPLSPGSGN